MSFREDFELLGMSLIYSTYEEERVG